MNKKRWSKNEVKFVVDNYDKMTIAEIADFLDRTRWAVESKIENTPIIFPEKVVRKHNKLLGERRSEYNKEHFQGKNNGNWKGGVAKNNYHYKKIQKERYPEKEKARCAIYYAVRKGNIKKKPCEVCGDIKSFAHHKDYTNKLDVIWLCRKHHDILHRKLKRSA